MAAWTKGEAVVAPFNALQVDVGTPGNWESVYGPPIFRKLMAELSEKVICGLKIAFVGLTDPSTTTRQDPAEVEGCSEPAE